MSKAQQNKYNKLKLARLDIVASLYKRGWTYRKIQDEVKRRLNLATYSLGSVKNDVDTLLAEWRASRLSDIDDLVQLELERIDEACHELWGQWELSKESTEKTSTRKKATGIGRTGGSPGGLENRSVETTTEEQKRLGNPAYIAEIRQQLQERRKLLGLYSPEKAIIKTESDMTREDIENELARLEKLTATE